MRLRITNTVANNSATYRVDTSKNNLVHANEFIQDARTKTVVADKTLQKEEGFDDAFVDKTPLVPTFNIGDTVRSIAEHITGTISAIANHKLIINWDDNTKERLPLQDAPSEIELIDTTLNETASISENDSKDISENDSENDYESISAYVDTTETLVNPTEPSTSNPEKLDMEKIKLQHKIDRLEDKASKKQINDVKYSAASKIISLAVQKGMITQDEYDMEMMKVSALNDAEFKEYEDSVMQFSDDGSVVETMSDAQQEDDYAGMTKDEIEAHKALKALKIDRGLNLPQSNFSDSEPRNLAEASMESGRPNTRDISSFTPPVKLEDALSSLLDEMPPSNQHEPREKTASVKRSVKGFENLQGLTKPLVMGQDKPAFQAPSNTDFSQLFAELEWSSPLKRR